MTETELKKALQSTSVGEIEQALLHVTDFPSLAPLIDLFESVWKMTYACSTDPEFREIQNGGLAAKLALMNEQEDLLPKELTAIEDVTELDLGGFPEAVLFPELYRYKKLRKLQLWENDLKTLPDGFYDMNTLEELYLCCNLEELSPGIGNLKRLKLVILSGNRLTQIPTAIQTLNKLEELDLAANLLTQLPDALHELPGLKTLAVCGNPELVVSEEEKERFRQKGIDLIL